MSFIAQKDAEEEEIMPTILNNFFALKKDSSYFIKIFLYIHQEVTNSFSHEIEKNIPDFSKSIIQNKKTIF